MIECCQKRRVDLRKMPTGARVPKTWKSPLQKAIDPDTEYQWLHDIADGFAEPLRRAFLKALQTIRGSVQEAELRAAIASGSIERVLAVLGLDKKAEEILAAAMAPHVEDAMTEAGRQAPAKTITGNLAMRFDLRNPYTADFIKDYDYRLIREIADDTRAGIKQVVSDAFEYGGHPYEQARIIRESIGLTQTQANAVDNFRSLLVNRDRDALSRALRDRRFDPTLDAALGEAADRDLSDEQIGRMVDRYRERYVSMRAKTIARTETIRAANAGQQIAWRQAADKGFLDRHRARMGWMVTPDDRLCIICAAIPLLNPNGIPLGGMFITPEGMISGPTAHPNCRCITYLMAL